VWLVQATNRNFYASADYGGAFPPGCGIGCGTVLELTAWGAPTSDVHSFIGQPDGEFPNGLIQATDGNFYGTAYQGGTNGDGTVFKITPSGTYTTIYGLCAQSNCTDGSNPGAALIQATDGNFYGTTTLGGANGGGTIFQITSSGALTTLYSFCSQSNCTDGEYAEAALIQETNGTLYGTTAFGGASTACFGSGCGTISSLSVGLGPFVETLPTSANYVGAPVKILGTNLTGATSVTFNGTPASFRVVSASEISTTLPAGATTGTVQVVTPSGTLSSNVPFRVEISAAPAL
jgi:uncharacterized repeat protein (TIGR03803 family)